MYGIFAFESRISRIREYVAESDGLPAAQVAEVAVLQWREASGVAEVA